VLHHDGFLNRQLLYACKAYAQQFNAGVNYASSNPVFLLTILDYEILSKLPDWLHSFSFRHEGNPDIKIDGLSMRLIELGKRRKMDNFNLDNPVDRWLTFLAEPEKLITMQKFDLSVYPNLMKAVEILDRSNFSLEQQIAYDNHLFAVADINQTRIESFDKGFEEGLEEGFDLTLNLIDDLEKGVLSNAELAEKYSKSITVIEKLAAKFRS
jgi:predicted transposase/invertase (TIGR01784 family)